MPAFVSSYARQVSYTLSRSPGPSLEWTRKAQFSSSEAICSIFLVICNKGSEGGIKRKDAKTAKVRKRKEEMKAVGIFGALTHIPGGYGKKSWDGAGGDGGGEFC